jgi:branched-chain amino acid transport system permease protein
MDYLLIAELVISGAFTGLMYALVSLGIVLIYKTSGLANFAQGAIAMTGGYITWAISAGLGAPMWLAIPAALAAMFAFGLVIERVALRRMKGPAHPAYGLPRSGGCINTEGETQKNSRLMKNCVK